MNFSSAVASLLLPSCRATSVPPPAAAVSASASASASALVSASYLCPPPHDGNNDDSDLLTDATLHVPHDKWFKLLQGVGMEMTEMEAMTYSDNMRKCKTRTIAYAK